MHVHTTHYPYINNYNLLAVLIALCNLQWIPTDGGLDGSPGHPSDADEQPLFPVELKGQSNEEDHEDSDRQATEHRHYSLACRGSGRKRGMKTSGLVDTVHVYEWHIHTIIKCHISTVDTGIYT